MVVRGKAQYYTQDSWTESVGCGNCEEVSTVADESSRSPCPSLRLSSVQAKAGTDFPVVSA